MNGMPALLACAFAGVLFCRATAGQAQPSSAVVTAAEALFEQGRVAMAEGHVELACSRFRESNRLDPAVGTLLNLADCEERRGKLATAWSLFRSAVSELPADDDRMVIAQERVEALAPQVPKLVLKRSVDAPQDVRARLAGAEFASASFGVPLPMDPGHYEIVASAPGHDDRSFSVQLDPGETAQVELLPGEPLPMAMEQKPPVVSGSSRRTWTYVIGGVGLGGVLVGAVTGVITLNKKSIADSNCWDSVKQCNAEGADASDSGRTFAAISTTGFVVGAAGISAAAYLLLTEPDEPQRAALRASFGTRSAGLTYSGSF